MATTAGQIPTAQVVEVFLASFSASGPLRKEAEAKILELCRLPGAAAVLLGVAQQQNTGGGGSGGMMPIVPMEVRQAAAIALKNLVKRSWPHGPEARLNALALGLESAARESGEPALFSSDQEARAAREACVEALLRETEPAVRDQFAEVVNEVALKDFPARWPELVPRLTSAIEARRSTAEAHGALLALRKVCKRFEFKSKEEGGRQPVEGIVTSSFELLRGLLSELVEASEQHAEAAALAKLVLKVFWSCTQFALPEVFLAEPRLATLWFSLVKRCLEIGGRQQQSQHVRHDDPQLAAWESSQFWKMKKWAAQIAARFIARYGRAKYVDARCRPFAEVFCAESGPPLLEAVLGLLAASSAGAFVSSRVKQLAFTYVDSAVELGALYKLMRPHLDFVLFDAALPALCATPKEVEEFDLDPQEYVRRSHDPMEDFLDPRAAASNLLAGLVRTRRADVFDKLLNRLAQTLATYEQLRAENRADVRAMVLKDGALCALGALSEELAPSRAAAADNEDAGGGSGTKGAAAAAVSSSSKTGKRKSRKNSRKSVADPAAVLDQILDNHVLPETRRFERGNGFLRARACWVLQQFATHLDTLSTERVASCANAALLALEDPALPVRVEAAGAIRSLLASSENPRVPNMLRPALPTILEHCFKIMSDVGSDDVVQALEIVIDRFGDDIAPYAVALAQKLAQAFAAYAAAADDDDEASMAAAQCVTAMAATLQSLDDNRDNVYARIEPYLVPVLSQIYGSAQGDFLEYFEDGIEVLSYLSYNGATPFSRDLWMLFEQLIDAFHGWAYDYIADLVSPLDNFVSRDTATFLAGATSKNVRYLDALISVADRFVGSTQGVLKACERDAVKATYILLSVLHNCPRGSVDAAARKYAWLCAELVPLSAGPTPFELLRAQGADTTDDSVRAAEFEAGSLSAAAAKRKPWRRSLTLALSNVWASVLTYDAALAVDAVSRHPNCGDFLQTWLDQVLGDPTKLTPFTTKLAILALSALVQTEAGVRDPRFARRLVELVDPDPEEAADEDDDDLDPEEDDDDHEDDDDFVEANFDEDVDDPEDEAYLAALRGGSGIRDVINSLDLDDDVADDEAVYCSPLDDQDENFRALDALKALHAQHILETLAQSFPAELNQKLQLFVQNTEARLQAHLQAAAAENNGAAAGGGGGGAVS